MRTEPSGGSYILPVPGYSHSGTATADHSRPPPVQGLGGVPVQVYAAFAELSTLTAIGVSLPPPSLMQSVMNLPAAASGVDAQDPANGAEKEADASAEAAPDAALAEGTEADLTEDEQLLVEELQQRDREVRQHEQAHMAAAGGHARGGASYEYTTGPDGKRYAAGGEVSIDTSKVSGDPAATIRKAQLVYRAALAPAEPSGQDRSVASQAKQMEMEARQELTQQQLEEGRQGTDETGQMEDDGSESPDQASSIPSSTDQGGDVGALLDLLG